MPRILLVDDDETVRDVVGHYLRAATYEVVEQGDGIDALLAATSEQFDLIILDLMLPGLNGIDLYQRLRAEHIETPIIMLTAKTDEQDRILGLEMGADDYISKPFSPRELVLRVQMVLRRTSQQDPAHVLLDEGCSDNTGKLCDGELCIDFNARKAYRNDRILNLTLREFDLLSFMMSHPNRVFTRDELMEAVWGWEFGDPSTVTVHVRRVRSKIEKHINDPKHLITVWGRGYRWDSAS